MTLSIKKQTPPQNKKKRKKNLGEGVKSRYDRDQRFIGFLCLEILISGVRDIYHQNLIFRKKNKN